jgi:hypothetical protein
MSRRAGGRAALLGLAALVAAAFLLATACGSGERSAVGVIVDVQASSLAEVESFTLRTDDGELLTFRLAPEAPRSGEEAFVASHLRSHASLAQRVKIIYREEDGVLLAVRLVDQ